MADLDGGRPGGAGIAGGSGEDARILVAGSGGLAALGHDHVRGLAPGHARAAAGDALVNGVLEPADVAPRLAAVVRDRDPGRGFVPPPLQSLAAATARPLP